MTKLLLDKNNINLLKEYKFRNKGTSPNNIDNTFPGHNIVTRTLPKLFSEELARRGFDLSSYEIRGSVGEGRMSEVFWIALLNEDFVSRNKSGKLTTQSGIYIVLLFDRELENAYLSIANGTELLNLKALKALSRNQINIIKNYEQVKQLQLNESFDLYLGNSLRPQKYSSGIPVYKAYSINNIVVDDLINDFFLLNELLEIISLDKGLNELESEIRDKVNGKVHARKITSISVDKYKALRKRFEEKNKKTGEIAEGYVFEIEKNKLTNIGREDLSSKITWVSKEFDGYGYDIKSYDAQGNEKYIEVKSTSTNNEEVAFFLSENEKRVSEMMGDRYYLYLVSNVRADSEPKIVEEICNPSENIFKNLTPIQYKGVYKPKL